MFEILEVLLVLIFYCFVRMLIFVFDILCSLGIVFVRGYSLSMVLLGGISNIEM